MKTKGWLAEEIENGDWHISPIDDLRPHVDSRACWCKPFIVDEIRVCHNSLDQRELLEDDRAELDADRNP